MYNFNKRQNFQRHKRINGYRVKSKQSSLRIEGGATIDDDETVADLFNEYFANNAGKKIEQFDQTSTKFNLSPAGKSMFFSSG